MPAYYVFMFAAYTRRRASEILALECEQIVQSLYTHIQPEHLLVVADKIDDIYTEHRNVIDFVKTG